MTLERHKAVNWLRVSHVVIGRVIIYALMSFDRNTNEEIQNSLDQQREPTRSLS